MKVLKEQQEELKRDRFGLTEYHWEQRRLAEQSMAEMLKHPYSLEQCRAQVARNKNRH